MMTKRFLLLPVLFVVLFVFLQLFYKFHFFYVEQNQLFQNAGFYIIEHLFQVGGTATVISQFLVQFFTIPYAGATITALLLTIAGWLTYVLIRKMMSDSRLEILCLLTVVTLLFAHFNLFYKLAGTVAFLMMLATQIGTIKIKKFTYRLIAACLFTALLYLLAGAIFALYAVVVILYECLFGTGLKRFWIFLLAAEVAVISWLSVFYSHGGEYVYILLPNAYYDYDYGYQPPSVIYSPWISVLLLVCMAKLFTNRKMNRKSTVLFYGISAAVILFFCLWGIPRYDERNMYPVKELDYYARTEQWDIIKSLCEGDNIDFQRICYLNRSLAEKGVLADSLFFYHQSNPDGLIPQWNKSKYINILLSDVFFTANNISNSQRMAFEAFESTDDNDPRILKRLVQTNLIYGAYPVAEKYIRILENTFVYKDWALSQRRFLYNDPAVENDVLLGAKRKSLPPSNRLLTYNAETSESLLPDLETIAEANPEQKTAIEYAGAYYLLKKDMEGFTKMINKYFNTPVLPALPLSFQEAVIVMFESQSDQWRYYRLSDDVIRRFDQYRETASQNSANPKLLRTALAHNYKNTFWYFLMFK